jgi:small subunit ribosomal protein S18e
LPRADQFVQLLRILNTNVNGKHKVPYALRIIKGIGRRFAILCCKIAQVDVNRRAGDLTEAEINKISDIFAKPTGKSIVMILVNGRVTNKGVRVCRVRSSQVVLEQTEMHQRRYLVSGLLKLS